MKKKKIIFFCLYSKKKCCRMCCEIENKKYILSNNIDENMKEIKDKIVLQIIK